jgi:hypothetical protein
MAYKSLYATTTASKKKSGYQPLFAGKKEEPKKKEEKKLTPSTFSLGLPAAGNTANSTPMTTNKNEFGPAVDLFQGINKSAGGVGLDLAYSLNKLNKKTKGVIGSELITPETNVKIDEKSPAWQKVIFGQGEIKSNAKKIADFETKYQNKLGPKTATSLGFIGTIGMSALDFTPFGGEKNLVKELTLADDAIKAGKILRKAGVAEDVIKSYAPKFAETKNATEIEKGLESLKKLLKETKVAGGEVAENVGKKAINKFSEIKVPSLMGDIKTRVVTKAVEDLKPLKPEWTNLSGKLKPLIKQVGEDGKINVPLIVNKADNTIIDGNHRLMAAIKNGIKEVPVVYVNDGKLGMEYDEINKLKEILLERDNVSKVDNVVSQAVKNTAPTPQEIESVAQRMVDTLTNMKPLTREQKAVYSAERGVKIQKALENAKGLEGEEAFIAKTVALKGELSKVQFEPARVKIVQEDIKTLYNAIDYHPMLTEFEKITAGNGLKRILNGSLPRESELKLLGQVFPSNVVKAILDKRSMFGKLADIGIELANVPRAVMSSVDVSAPFRQGLFLASSHPKSFFKAFAKQFEYFGSEKSFQKLLTDIRNRPTFSMMERDRLAFLDMNATLNSREEQFMSNFAEKIPVFGKLVRASSRAYTGFLNLLRADVYDELVKGAIAVGRNPASDEELGKGIARFVNTFSGRGQFGSKEMGSIANFLNGVFFSPRLMASRITMLNPAYYIKADPFVRKEALKAMFSTVGVGMTVLGLAKMNGAKVGTDSNSSDFGKIIINNTRLDIWGGLQQYIRMFSQILSGKYVSSTSGKESILGEGYKPLTRYDIFLRQLESKEAPIASFVTQMLKGQDYLGQPTDVKKEIKSRFTPMFISDLVELAKSDPSLLPIGLLGGIGFGVQTYQPSIKKNSAINKAEINKPNRAKINTYNP